LTEEGYAQFSNMKEMSNASISRRIAVSLPLRRGTSRFVCGTYVMAQEEQSGTERTGSSLLHLVQMGDMSPLEMVTILSGYGTPALVSSWRNAWLHVSGGSL
jgi:hypothetical protein